jgi:hypothetical protein
MRVALTNSYYFARLLRSQKPESAQSSSVWG